MHSFRLRGGLLAVALPVALLAVAASSPAQATKKDPKDEFQTRWASVAKKVAQQHVSLARKFTDKKVHEMAWEEYLRAAALDPSNTDAQRALGRKFEKDKGAWVDTSATKSKKNEGSASELKLKAKECADERIAAATKMVADIEQLAIWAEANNLKDSAKDLWKRILRDYDPKNDRALTAMGWQFIDGHWVSPDDLARRGEGKKRLADSVDGEAVTEESELERTMGWKLVKRKSPHFFLEGMHTEDEMKELIRDCEAAHTQFREAFKLGENAFPKPIHGIFLADPSHFGDWVDRASGIKEDERAIYKKLGGYTSAVRLVLANCQAEHEWNDIKDDAVHMTTHMLFNNYAPMKSEPPWLREGIAYWVTERLLQSAYTLCLRFETGSGSDKGFTDVREWPGAIKDAIADGSIPSLRTVMLSDMNSLSVAKIMKAWSFVDFMLTVHPDKFFAFINALKEGKDQEAALKQAFGGLGFVDVDALWLAHVKAKS